MAPHFIYSLVCNPYLCIEMMNYNGVINVNLDY